MARFAEVPFSNTAPDGHGPSFVKPLQIIAVIESSSRHMATISLDSPSRRVPGADHVGLSLHEWEKAGDGWLPFACY